MSVAEKLTKIAENEQKVCEAGKVIGRDEQCCEFWDSYTDCGNRTDYKFAFYSKGWNNKTFKPTVVLRPKKAESMFAYSEIVGDLTELAEIDFSATTEMKNAFYSCSEITHIGEINTSQCTGYASCFYGMRKLVGIKKLAFSGRVSSFGSMFQNCVALKDIVIEGVIRGNISFQYSTELTHDSLMSILNALYDSSGTSTTYKLTIGSENYAKLTDEEIAIAESKNWEVV